jgi:hypothetical protein
MIRSRLWSSALGGGCLLLLAGCDPKILTFDVQPRRVCAGDSVHISWKVRGTPHLETARRTEDSVEIIRYTIVSESHGKRAFSSKDVVTFTPAVPTVFVAETAMQGNDTLVARDSARTAVWHSLVQVGVVGTDSGRQLLVRHAGREGVIGPDRKGNAVWRGLPVSGPWEIRSGLQRGEIPGNPAHHPPQHLSIRVGLVCAGRGAPHPPA